MNDKQIMEKRINESCIFLNIELDEDNINSKDEKLGTVPRYHEQETIRLIQSIRGHKDLHTIKIYVIMFKPYTSYSETTRMALKDFGVSILIPKLSKELKEKIKYFHSGFWYIPLTGLLIENTRRNPKVKKDVLFDVNGREVNLPQFGLKLDADMVLIHNPFERLEFVHEHNYKKPVCGYYSQDEIAKDENYQHRLIYGIDNMSNTCLIYSNLDNNHYGKWWEYLINEDDSNQDNSFGEVAFDVTHPFITHTIPLFDFQIGPNYLCPADLDKKAMQNILFYHGKLNENENILQKVSECKYMRLKLKSGNYKNGEKL